MDRKLFFANLRRQNSGLFGTSLTQKQVKGIEAILDAARGLPITYIAYILATPYLETAKQMWPVKETVYAHHKDKNPSDATVIKRLDRAYAKGQLGQVSRPYWRDGMFGRGLPQLTHKRNYEKAGKLVGLDLVNNPDLALEVDVSAAILVKGMLAGTFTGRKLSDYLPGDYVNARKIINGNDRKHEIASTAGQFETVLRASGWADPPATAENLDPVKPPVQSHEVKPGLSGREGVLITLALAVAGGLGLWWDKLMNMIGL